MVNEIAGFAPRVLRKNAKIGPEICCLFCFEFICGKGVKINKIIIISHSASRIDMTHQNEDRGIFLIWSRNDSQKLYILNLNVHTLWHINKYSPIKTAHSSGMLHMWWMSPDDFCLNKNTINLRASSDHYIRIRL